MSYEFRPAGLIYGPEFHHLDHLGPLCSFLEIPLVVTEEKIARLALNFYPNLHVICSDYLDIAQYLVSHFDIIFYSIPRDLFDEVFFIAQKIQQKKVHTIWCPHGNSDKGNAIYYMEALKKEEAALVYGKQMIEFLKRKHVFDQLQSHVITGNFRYQFYLKHQAFYDDLAQEIVFKQFQVQQTTLLYAPTWRDYENSTSFHDAINPLIENLPPHQNLMIKLHPNLYQQDEFKIDHLKEKYNDLANVFFIEDFPALYPLLQKADIYIGDMSSIGYDYLVFNRPMFFLNQNSRNLSRDPGVYLFRCGVEIQPEEYDDIHNKIENYLRFELRDFSEIRKEVYHFAFSHDKSIEELKRQIRSLFNIFPEPDLNLF